MTKTFKDFVEQVKADNPLYRVYVKEADPKFPGDEGAVTVDPGGRHHLYSVYDGVVYDYHSHGAIKVGTLDTMHNLYFGRFGAEARFSR